MPHAISHSGLLLAGYAELRTLSYLVICRLVRPGGLLVLELSHPDELFSGSFFSPDEFVDAWDAAVGDKSVLVEWGREGDDFNSTTQVFHCFPALCQP